MIDRVVMVAALVDDRLATLAGIVTAKLAPVIRPASAADPAPSRRLIEEVLQRAHVAMEMRNAIVHSLPNPSLERAWVHRQVPEKNRPADTNPSVAIEVSGTDVQGLIAELAAIYQQIRGLEPLTSHGAGSAS